MKPLDLSNLSNLISIRLHISTLVNNSNIEKSKVRPLLDMQTVIDKAIVDGILSEDFSNALNQPLKIKKEAIPEIKSGLLKE
jgi:hypothetical protein